MKTEYETQNGLNPRHWEEIVTGSGISETIARLNFWTVTDPVEADQLLGRNSQRRWQHSNQLVPGWAVAGVDPQTGEPLFLGVQFKPDTAPLLKDGKPLKYLGASGVETYPLFLNTGDETHWPQALRNREIRILITEGAKKAGCLLTLGYAAISLPGVWNGQKKGRLHQALELFCGVGRVVYLCFDSDAIAKASVQQALDRLGRLLSAKGCVISVVVWDDQYKGIDDLYIGAGAAAVHEAIAKALTFEEWRDQIYQTRGQRAKGAALASQKNGNPGVTFLQQAEAELFGTGRWICFADKLYRWEGTHYQVRTDEAEYPRIKQFADTFEVTKSTLHGTEITYPYARPSSVKQILDWVKQGFCVTTETVNPAGINCRNGVLELYWDGKQLSVKLIHHDPDKHLFLSAPQATYNPDADPTEYEQLMKCLAPGPRQIWERTIATGLDIDTVRKFKGRAVKALFLKGDGSNGKDTLRVITEMLMGQGAIASCSATDWKQYDSGRAFPIFNLKGKRLNWPSENADIGRVDALRGLRAAITGDPITFEAKNKMATQEPCRSVFLFNCNEAPNIVAQLKATSSRWGIVPFNQTYSLEPGPDELQADPRYKEDPIFVREKILPAFLNRLLEQLQAVVHEGIDYTCTQDLFEELQRENSHLLQFAHDTGLQYAPGKSVTVKAIWERLRAWYIETGTLEIEETVTARSGTKEKLIWNEQPRKGDRNVKGANQVAKRFLEIFPKAKRATVTTDDGHNRNTVLTGVAFLNLDDPEFKKATSEKTGYGDYGNGGSSA